MVRLVDALVRDSWGAPVVLDESWTTWEDIPPSLLNQAECLLNYFEGSDLRYFLPAFLAQATREFCRGSELSSATSSLAHYLGRWARDDYRELDLEPGQREVLDGFLALAETSPAFTEGFRFWEI